MASRRTALTDQLHVQLLQAFREHNGEWSLIAAKVGLDPRTVRKAWEVGWPMRLPPWDVPMRAIIEKEQELARATLAAQAAHAPPKQILDQSKIDAAEQLAQSVTMIRSARKATNAFFGVVGVMLPAVIDMAKKLPADVQNGLIKGEDAIRAIGRVTRMAGIAVQMADTVQVMEHREVGKPTDIIALARMGSDASMTMEEAERELKAAQAAIERAKAAGMVITGMPETPNAEPDALKN